MTSRCLLALALCPSLALAAFDTNHFQFCRALSGPAPVRTGPVSVAFDADIHRATNPDHGDLRIVDDRGMETPRAIEKVVVSATRLVHREVPARAVALKELPDNRISAEFELTEAGARIDGLDIRTPLHDFVRSVSVHGRPDAGAEWQPLAPGGEIFDYRRYLDVRQTSLALPSNACSHFRVEIGNASEERAQPLIKLVQQSGGRDAGAEIRTLELLRTPFRMDGISFWRNVPVTTQQEEVRREWERPELTVSTNEKDRVTEVIVPAGRIPLNRLILDIEARNFSRAARVQARTVQQGLSAWRDIGGGRLIHVDLPGYARQELTLDFPERRAEELRVLIDYGDNPPLARMKVRAFGPSYRLLFLAEPDRSYRLLYGSPGHAAPAYDLDAVLAPTRQGLQAAEWKLEPQAKNPAWRARSSVMEWLNTPAAMTGAIIVMALVLLGLLALSLKRVGKKLEDTDENP